MHMWDNEDYFLQIDSHHRFAQDWDIKMIAFSRATNSALPILTTYGTEFDIDYPEVLVVAPCSIVAHYFTADGILLAKAANIPEWRTRSAPLRARFLAAGFLFAPGRFVRDVPYDPDLYFMGEEITMTVRAFTAGYDLFHPPTTVIWHQYHRHGSDRHWHDHTQANGVERAWYLRDLASRKKVRQFFETPTTGPYGLGTVRSLDEYQHYAGIDFRRRLVYHSAIVGIEPPTMDRLADWMDRIPTWNLTVVIPRSVLPPAALADPYLWQVRLTSADNHALLEINLQRNELSAQVSACGDNIVFWLHVTTAERPIHWTVQPVSVSLGWFAAISGKFCDQTSLRGQSSPPAAEPGTCLISTVPDAEQDPSDTALERIYRNWWTPHMESDPTSLGASKPHPNPAAARTATSGTVPE